MDCARSSHLAVTLTVLLLGASPAHGQAGDKDGEEQPPLPPDLAVPPAPALSPEDELATFRFPDDVRVELVAAEPLVADPVAAVFDDRGRLWVAEMRGYMPDVDGTGEEEPVGTIAVLSDTNGDGRMDRRQVFLDGLVLPRALAPADDGLLVIAPPELFFARDTDGDGRADERRVLATGMGGIHSPEHAINGLLYGHDNAYWCSQQGQRWLRDGDRWFSEPTAGGGQWGLTKDDVGRMFFNTNPDPLRGDRYDSTYAIRNPHHGRASGVNVRVAEDKATWPARITPGVNRGYRPETLRDDYTLATFTAACAPWIYRGNTLPKAYRGDAFVCEPAGNLVRRYTIEEDASGRLTGENPYPRGEFLTSTDERFRPVNLLGGPDGGLYVLDMYRGVIQHRLFVTSFLRRQIEERELEEPIGMGRVWRILPKEGEWPIIGPDLSQATWSELVRCLSHPVAWWRDNAQRVLVEEGRDSVDAIELLREAARDAEQPLGRLHALWALDGIEWTDPELCLAALDDEDRRVRHAAIRVSERWLGEGGAELLARLVAVARSGDPWLRHQVLLSLGEARSAAGDGALLALATDDVCDSLSRSAVLSGLAGRELASSTALLAVPDWRAEAEGRATFVRLLARCVGREGLGERIERVLDRATANETPGWQRAALVQGLLDARPPLPDGKPGYLQLARRPEGLAQLEASEASAESDLADCLAWPGREGIDLPVVRPLTGDEEALFERGREVYSLICASCHKATGTGEDGLAPPLRYSEWVLGPPSRLVRLVSWGLDGPIEVRGHEWNLAMPAWSSSDEDLAAVLTYVRRQWGHGADPVTPEEVGRVRESVGERRQPWTAEELLTE